MTAEIVAHSPGAILTRTRLAVTTRVGAASDNELCLGQPGVARYHARLVREDSGYYAEAAAADATLRVNGIVQTRVRLDNLDVLTLAADVDLVFLQSDVQTAPLEAPAAAAERAQVSRVTLEWMNGPDQGTTVPITRGDLVIGRGDTCGLVINLPALSRVHSRLSFNGDVVTIADAGSANGTAVNGRRIDAPIALQDGDEITFGNQRTAKMRIETDGSGGTKVPRYVPAVRGVPGVPAVPAAPAVLGTVLDLQWQSKLIWNGPEAGEAAPAPAVTGDRTRFDRGAGPVAPPVMPNFPADGPASEAGRTRLDASRGPVGPPLMPDFPAVGPSSDADRTKFDGGGGVAPPVMPGEDRGVKTTFQPAGGGVMPPVVPDFDRLQPGNEGPAEPRPADRAQAAPGRTDEVETRLVDAVIPLRPAGASAGAITGARLRGATNTFTVRVGKSTVGRAVDAEVKLGSRTVSRAHAIIEVSGTEVIVEDLGKENGTEVNGVRVKGRRPLQNGDKLGFAEEAFTVEILRDETS